MTQPHTEDFACEDSWSCFSSLTHSPFFAFLVNFGFVNRHCILLRDLGKYSAEITHCNMLERNESSQKAAQTTLFSTYSFHQRAEGWSVQHQGIKNFITLLPHIQQNWWGKGRYKSHRSIQSNNHIVIKKKKKTFYKVICTNLSSPALPWAS